MINLLEFVAPEGRRKAHAVMWADMLLFTIALVLGLWLHETSIPLACVTAIAAMTTTFLGLNAYENKRKNGNGTVAGYQPTVSTDPDVPPRGISGVGQEPKVIG